MTGVRGAAETAPAEPPNTEPPNTEPAHAGPILPIDLADCAREPIHLSGAIQPHGVLLAVREADLIVRQASVNTARHVGLDPEAVLGAPLARVLGEMAAARLRDALADPRASGSDPQVVQPIRGSAAYEMTWHRMDGLVIVELEPIDVAESMSMVALFADVRHAVQVLQGAQSTQSLHEALAAEVRHLTGYDRVMIYRFHPDWHGEVVAEELETDLEPLLGLHYPASDIPTQARKLYRLNRLRVIANVDYEPAALLGAPGSPDEPLDLSLSGLRSVSPFHLSYLRNMNVRATLTISLMQGTRLWGMVACHNCVPKRVDAQLRAACRLLGQVFSVQLSAQEVHERQGYRAQLAEVEAQLVDGMAGAEFLLDGLRNVEPLPLHLTAADGMVACIGTATVSMGEVPPRAAIDLLLSRLGEPDEPAELVCDDLPHRFPELGAFASTAAGVIAIPLSGSYEDYILWFRAEFLRSVQWAGKTGRGAAPEEPPGRPGPSRNIRLGPQASFDAWSVEVQGRSRPWLPAEVDTARSLAAAIPELRLSRARDHLSHLAQVAQLAMHDPLTGLPNRALLFERTAQALARQARGGPHVALLFIDLDRFKLVNDSLGHAAGDSVLLQAAQRLVTSVRDGDTVARIGGDEFIVLCTGTEATQADRLANRIVESFRAPFRLDGHEALVTASVGVAVAEATETPADLLRDADRAMYRAKNSGRNGAAAFTPELRATAVRRVEIETSLRPALERRELQLHFQPIHTAGGALSGFEALARWPMPNRGMIPPDEFIPVAETTGLIEALTDWVLEEALERLAGWRRARPELELTIAVNVAAAQMRNGRLQLIVDRNLQRWELPPESLCLEITESALVTDDAVSQNFLRQMREKGVRLSIDDFGTGYSSLSYLTKLPVHELKIDRAFISGLPDNQANVAVVTSVVGLAHQLGLRALAEGVETQGQLAAVRRLGCDLVQGYLLGRPMPADAVDRLLAGPPDGPQGGLSGSDGTR